MAGCLAVCLAGPAMIRTHLRGPAAIRTRLRLGKSSRTREPYWSRTEPADLFRPMPIKTTREMSSCLKTACIIQYGNDPTEDMKRFQRSEEHTSELQSHV